MEIARKISELQRNIPENVTIVAVSKTKTISQMMEAYQAGIRHFGENKAQELVSKYQSMPGDVHWHFIGHLQSNKVKLIAPFVDLIHSLDSIDLLQEIHRQAIRSNRVIDCLLQFHIASEETKYGMDSSEAHSLLEYYMCNAFPNLRITGVMGMASFTENTALIHHEFHNLRKQFLEIKSAFFKDSPQFSTISMGMSGDYKIAIDEGSTMVRVGTSIFGDR